MEFASKLRWILVIVVSVIFLILVCWGLYSIAKNTFSTDNNEETISVQEDEVAVESTATARYTVEGPIVANQNQRSYTITVSNNSVNMKVYGGYGSFVISERSYPNTQDSYTAFLSALDNASITSVNKNSSDLDEFAKIGVCSTGRKFIVELDQSTRRWSTSCSSKEGNAGFQMPPVATLFQRQVPDFNTLVSGTGL